MNHNKAFDFRYFWPALLWAIFVFVLSALPGNAFPRINGFWDWLGPDKAIHLLFYGFLSYLLLRGFYRQYGSAVKRFYPEAVALLTGTVFGILMEVMQHFVFTGRDGNIYDALANTMGCLFGIMIFKLVKRKKD